MRLDHGDGHDVEDAAGVGVFGVSEFVVTPAILKNFLNLAVDLTAIRAFEINSVFPVRGDGVADRRDGLFATEPSKMQT